ncbi:Proline iminopeptidase [Seminavis robusta]|uniref:Proline iminopeptidase n=1 Tax=Seminavis robusta TaxID=568900 RepID=A0A9N8DSU4_9STRA|nr:Proline iminopeptidase [Seminavis robusta]|eukprot:Sro227_g092250.1 Proline iminopeptidase (353) ;mRNA; r:33423-34481
MRLHSNDFRIPLEHGHSLFAREVTKTPRDSVSGDTPGACSSSSPLSSEDVQPAVIVIVVHGGPGLNSHEESYDGIKNLLLDWNDKTKPPASSDGTATSGEYFKWINAIVFYDQLGCGCSEGPPLPPGEEDKAETTETPGLYSLSYYVLELQQVIQSIRLRYEGTPTKRICVLGHSWGGQVVLEYLLGGRHQASKDSSSSSSIDCAIISNTPLNEATYAQRQQEIRNALPNDVRAFLEQDDQQQASNDSVPSKIYHKLIGQSETDITGEMAGWDALQRLPELSLPCLFITGTNDTIQYKEYEQLCGLPNPPQVLILEGGEHGPFYGATAPHYFRAIQRFLEHVSTGGSALEAP